MLSFNASRALELMARQVLALKGSIAEIESISDVIASTSGVVVVTGIGKSGHVGAKFASSLRSISVRSIFLHPSEAQHGDMGFLAPRDLLLTVTSSGETEELVPVIEQAKSLGVATAAVLSRKHSRISNLVTHKVVAEFERELDPLALLPTSSSTTSLIALDLILCLVASKLDYSEPKFAINHPGGNLGFSTTRNVESVMAHLDNCGIVGQGQNFAEVADVMTNYPHGLVVVLDHEGEFLGVVTDGDLRRAMLEPNFSPDDTIANVVTKSPLSVESSDSVHYARLKLESHRPMPVGVAPVFRLGKLAGIVNLHHLYKGEL